MLYEDAARRRFDAVLFWSLDRFSREGLAQTIFYMQRLSSYGVGFHSYMEPHISTGEKLTRDDLRFAWRLKYGSS